MFKGIGNLASIVRQAQEMGGKMRDVGEQLKGKRAVGTAGGGMVEVEVNGLGEVLKVRIDPTLEDREMIEDLLPAAFNQAATKAKELHAELIQSVTQGLDVPGLSDALSQITGGDLKA